jgi:predicted DNA-binding transcriptional regulator AlpA
MDNDELVRDPQVCREFGIVSMTMWRWDHDPDFGFPPPIYIRNRKYRRRSEIEAFKQRMIASSKNRGLTLSAG